MFFFPRNAEYLARHPRPPMTEKDDETPKIFFVFYLDETNRCRPERATDVPSIYVGLGSIKSHYFHVIGEGHQPYSRGLYMFIYPI